MSPASSNRRRLGNKGVTSIEFGIVAMLLLSLIIGCMDLGRYYLVAISLRILAEEGARNAVATGPTAQGGCGTDLSQTPPSSIVPLLDITKVTYSAAWYRCSGVGVNTLIVTASYSFVPFTPIWASLAGTMTETSQVQF